jgi:cellulose synthase/poly-beta-1,6-N-acetylglucosamine synthase-like glycosyltransferase
VCGGFGSSPDPRWFSRFLSLRGERKRAAYVAGKLAEAPARGRQVLPPATVIVPVKGADPGLRENLAALAAQDYPDYELIVVAHSRRRCTRWRASGAGSRGAGARRRSPATGAKVLNLRTAVRFARRDSLLYAFADSDGRVSPQLAARAGGAPACIIAGRHADAQIGASTGYRWYAPDAARFLVR